VAGVSPTVLAGTRSVEVERKFSTLLFLAITRRAA
jgi:hypothetical protein